MATLKEILGEDYKDNMSLEEVNKYLESKKLVDLTKGDYVDKKKYEESARQIRELNKKIQDGLSEEAKKQAEIDQQKAYYEQLERENAMFKYTAKLSNIIQDKEILEEVATLYANGKLDEAIEKQSSYILQDRENLSKQIKDSLMKENPPATPTGDAEKMTKDKIMAIQDDDERFTAIANNLELFS